MGRKKRKPQVIGKRRDKHYSDIVKENQRFEDYYRTQKCFPLEEFDDFLAAMRTPLPAVFRITGYKDHAKQLLKRMKENHFSGIVNVKLDENESIQMPKPLIWYPDELAWQTNLSRTQIRKVPELEKFHNFLITETESGHVTRQESVSMIPPLLLDVKPHHKILDLCAAPGSKTAQLIEMLHKNSGSSEGLSQGLCIANDKDNKRCYMLVHQTNRLNSPVSLVVNHDGARFPELMIKNDEGIDVPLKYDRVLADVPCSGDGTMRKNTDVWHKWNVGNGLYLHGLQVRILQRGLELLEVGGRIVYSTCSLNPIEDEAVVSAMLTKCDGAIELVDVFNELDGLKWCPGVSNWSVLDRGGTWYEKYNDAKDKVRSLRPSMFPPENAEKYNLNRCMRLLPHYQDTGGFFVAVIKKTKPLPWEKAQRDRQIAIEKHCESGVTENKMDDPESVSNEKENVDATLTAKKRELDVDDDKTADDAEKERNQKECDVKSPPPKKRCWGTGFKEDPFVFLRENDSDKEIVDQIKSYYSLGENFPHNQLLTRTSSGKKRHIYMVSSLVRNIITNNANRLKLINTGVRVFSRCDNNQPNLQCHFRVVQDGSKVIQPFMRNRVVKVEIDDVIKLLCREQPDLNEMSDFLKNQLPSLQPGSMIFKYEPKDSESSVSCDLIMSGWKGNASVRMYLNKFERAHFLNLIGHDVPDEYLPNTNSRRRRAENAEGKNLATNGENGSNEIDQKAETEVVIGDTEMKESNNKVVDISDDVVETEIKETGPAEDGANTAVSIEN